MTFIRLRFPSTANKKTLLIYSREFSFVLQVADLREEAVRLRAENAHYSGVLSKTENILQELQDSVEREEKRWAEVSVESVFFVSNRILIDNSKNMNTIAMNVLIERNY